LRPVAVKAQQAKKKPIKVKPQDGSSLTCATVLFSKSESSGPAVSDDCEAWHDEFPNDQIPVLADTALELHDYIDVQSYPAMSVLDGDLKFIAYSNSGPYAALAKLLEL